MLLGTKFGTIFNKTFSSLFLTCALIILMCYSMNSTYKNMIKAHNREKQLEEKQHKEMFLINYNDDFSFQRIETSPKENNNELIQQIYNEDNNPFPMDKLKFMLMLEIIVIIDQIIEGNARVPSLLNIKRCSFIYWVVFMIYCLISLFLIKIAFDNINKRYEYKKRLNPNIKDVFIQYIKDNLIKIVILTTLAGVISSMVGVGGGMITNPILLGMGLDPKATSSTSTFLIMTTAIASSFIYTISGQLNLSYAVSLGIPCTLSAFFGSKELLRYINRTKRTSILLKIMFGFLIISMGVILVKTYFEIKETETSEIFKLKSYC